MVWIDLAQDRDKMACFCERGDELSVSTIGGEFLD
jgi:hypothetical protein